MPKTTIAPLTPEEIRKRSYDLDEAYRRIDRKDKDNVIAMQRLIITQYHCLLKDIAFRLD